MLRNSCFLLMSLLFFIACSDKDVVLPDDGPEPEPEVEIQSLPIVLKADKNRANIYEQVVFSLDDSLYTGPNGVFGISFRYSDSLDSLKWKIEGNDNYVHLLEKEGSYFSRFTFGWGHYFYLPGTYKIHLYGYKDDKIIVRDSAVTEIVSERDFLHISWNDLDENMGMTIGYPNNHTTDHNFSVYTSFRDNVLSSQLTVNFDSFDYYKQEPTPEVEERAKDMLDSYITELYGEPIYHTTDGNVPDSFSKLFKTNLKKDQVLKIWRTAKSNIALVKQESVEFYRTRYVIHAEPNLVD